MTMILHSEDSNHPLSELVDTSENAIRDVNRHLSEANLGVRMEVKSLKFKCILVSFSVQPFLSIKELQTRGCLRTLVECLFSKINVERKMRERHVAILNVIGYVYHDAECQHTAG